MKKLLIAGASLIALCSAAAAADMPVAQPEEAVVAAAAHDWSGFYAGVNVGFAKVHGDWTDVDGDWGSAGDVFGSEPSGITAGGQVGYNWLFGAALLGLEADINFADTNDNDNPISDIDRHSGMDWFATVRGRLGYTFGPGLIYATGGLAIADFEHSWFEPGDPDDSWPDFGDTEFGWTVGGGVEFMITDRLSVKAEGLFVKFDEVSSENDLGYEMEVEQEAVIGRVGLNYHF